MSEAIEELSEISRSKECRLVFTPNVDHLVLIDENQDFLKLYQSADFLLADGMPIVWFSRLMLRFPELKIVGIGSFVSGLVKFEFNPVHKLMALTLVGMAVILWVVGYFSIEEN